MKNDDPDSGTGPRTSRPTPDPTASAGRGHAAARLPLFRQGKVVGLARAAMDRVVVGPGSVLRAALLRLGWTGERYYRQHRNHRDHLDHREHGDQLYPRDHTAGSSGGYGELMHAADLLAGRTEQSWAAGDPVGNVLFAMGRLQNCRSIPLSLRRLGRPLGESTAASPFLAEDPLDSLRQAGVRVDAAGAEVACELTLCAVAAESREVLAIVGDAHEERPDFASSSC